ncbi:MAG: alpha/beta hydrolase [Leptolyngbya sp. Prado105]|jgi:hypothetical protein|nr:alpha/beta hydrolase [Leptolyngbya sp. Prado105]
MKLSSLHRTLLGVAVGVVTFASAQAANAANSIVFRYGAFSETVSVPELTEFAQTGRQSSTVRYFLQQTNQNPEAVRAALSREIPVQVTTLDCVLNSPIGDFVLSRLSRGIQTPGNAANYQALRGALVLSASDDNRVSLIEVFQNYPTNEVYLNGREIVSTYTEVAQAAQQIQDLAAIFRYSDAR